MAEMWSDLKPPKAPLTRTGKVAWLMSFVDLLSIVLCTFVLMFALKAVNMAQWETMRGEFRDTFAADSSEDVVVAQPADGRLNAEEVVIAPLTDGLRYLNSVLRRQVRGDAVWQNLQPVFDPERRWVSYTLPAAATAEDLQRLGRILRRWDNGLQLVAVAPVRTAPAALERAAAVRDLLRKGGVGHLDAVVWRPMNTQVAPGYELRVLRGSAGR